MNKKLILIILVFHSISVCGCSRLFKDIRDSSASNKTSNHQQNNNMNVINNNINNNDTIKENYYSGKNLGNDIAENLIASAKSIEKSLAILAAAQEVNNVPVLNTAPLITAEGGMGSTADIDWTGPIEPLLEKIALMTNYNLKVMGNKPSIPIIISITQNHAIIADILKNASLQAGKRVNIVVFPANKIIELRYRLAGLPYNTPSPHNVQIYNKDHPTKKQTAKNELFTNSQYDDSETK
jgi:defect in organelle trafficking protein DotD